MAAPGTGRVAPATSRPPAAPRPAAAARVCALMCHNSGTTRVNRQQGDRSGNALGENPEPPERPKPPGSRFSPRPPFLPPQHDGSHRANDRGTIRHDGRPVPGTEERRELPSSSHKRRREDSQTRERPRIDIARSRRGQMLTSASPRRRTYATLPERTAAPGQRHSAWCRGRPRHLPGWPLLCTRHHYRSCSCSSASSLCRPSFFRHLCNQFLRGTARERLTAQHVGHLPHSGHNLRCAAGLPRRERIEMDDSLDLSFP